MSRDTYWCDPESTQSEEFCDEFKKRTNEWYANLRNTAYYLWQRKAWKLYNNILGKNKSGEKGIQIAGEQGEYCLIGINNIRNLVKNLQILVAGNKPNFKSTPINNDSKSIEQGSLGEDIINYYMAEKRLEDFWLDTVEYALVLGEGYLRVTWDPNQGEQYGVEEETDTFGTQQEEIEEGQEEEQRVSQIVYEGDLAFEVYSPLDVIWDRRNVDFRKASWVGVRSWENRWDLLSRYPDARDEILNVKDEDERIIISKDFDTCLETHSLMGSDPSEISDLVPVWEFYHKRCNAIPQGRYVKMIGNAVVIDMPSPYLNIPVFQMLGGRTLLTGWGYTPTFDLIAPQEVLNACWSTVITELRRMAGTNIRTNRGDKVEVSSLPGGGRHFETNGPVDVLQMGQVAPEFIQTIEMANQYMEMLSGVNAITRGNIEGGKMSGTALALIDSKSIQFANDLVKNYYKLVEESATFAIRVIRDFAQTERVVSIVGQDHRGIASIAFTPDKLQNFNRFTLTAQNPLFKTTGGRMEVADKLLTIFGATGEIQPQEYINLIETGQLKPMYAKVQDEIVQIRRENEQLLRGEPTMATRYDNHPLHIGEHKILVSNPMIRNNEELLGLVIAHILHHRVVWDQLTANEPSVAQALGIPPSMMPQGLLPGQVPGGVPGTPGGQSLGVEQPMTDKPEVGVRPAKLPEPAIPPVQ